MMMTHTVHGLPVQTFSPKLASANREAKNVIGSHLLESIQKFPALP